MDPARTGVRDARGGAGARRTMTRAIGIARPLGSCVPLVGSVIDAPQERLPCAGQGEDNGERRHEPLCAPDDGAGRASVIVPQERAVPVRTRTAPVQQSALTQLLTATEPSAPVEQVAGQPSALDSRAWWPVAAAILAIAWGGNEFTPLLVLYREVSQFSPLVVDGLLAAYVLGIVPALLLGGPLSDIVGRRPVLLPAPVLALLGSGLLALGPGAPLLLGVGRVLCGAALGLVMAIGTAWIKELSDAAGEEPGTGARRAALALTLGFLLGAGVAALLAQFAPWPTRTTYLLHMLLMLVSGAWLLRAPETRPAAPGPRPSIGDLLARLRVPAVAHRRFLRVVIPVAPWVFGAAATAYAILPALLSEHAGRYPIAFAGLMTAVTLVCGVGIQSIGRGIDTHRSARASVIAMTVIAAGVSLAVLAVSTSALSAGLLAAAVLGCGYGLALVAGLSEVQRLAEPEDLGAVTAVFYSLTYLGFFIPMICAGLNTWLSYPTMLLVGAVLATLTLIEVAVAWSAHLPGAHD